MDDYLPEYIRCLSKRKRRAVSDFEPSCENYCVAGHCAVTCEREGRGLQWIMKMLPSYITNALEMGCNDDEDESDDFGSSSDCSCGVSQRNMPRIVGGQHALKNAYPWLVALVLVGSTNPFCGGTLLSSRTVLTAAHCRKSSYEFRVHVGEHDVRIADGEQKINVCSWESHPEYDENTFDNDFAIITLANNVIFSNTVMQACLPAPSTDYDSVVATVAGWGLLSYKGYSPYTPYEVDLDTMNNTACTTNTRYSTGMITNNMICASRPGKSSCMGDSGGPLMTKERNSFSVIGVVSWGPKVCARHDSPGVYARVTQQMPWIQERIQGTCFRM